MLRSLHVEKIYQAQIRGKFLDQLAHLLQRRRGKRLYRLNQSGE